MKVQNTALVAPPGFVGLLSPLEVTMVLQAAAPPAHGMWLWCWFPTRRLSGQPSSLPHCCQQLCPHVTHSPSPVLLAVALARAGGGKWCKSCLYVCQCLCPPGQAGVMELPSTGGAALQPRCLLWALGFRAEGLSPSLACCSYCTCV